MVVSFHPASFEGELIAEAPRFKVPEQFVGVEPEPKASGTERRIGARNSEKASTGFKMGRGVPSTLTF